MSAIFKALELVKQFEGCVLKAYPDPASADGLPVTIGYGSTILNGQLIKLGTKITLEQAEEQMMKDLEFIQKSILKFLSVKLNDNQLGALIDLSYNIGLQALRKSTLLKLINANPKDVKIEGQFLVWNRANGRTVPGLTRRRKAEGSVN